MAKTKFKELVSLSNEALHGRLLELRKEIMKENAQIARGTTLKSPGKLKTMKKDVSRILTALTQQTINAQKLSSNTEGGKS